ncbi:hypothetical protein [Mesobacillus harenae]|uniref:hypothetical protein n=1 Tax=Mesobacillus harenae TaxID=2213203 RepID=UPI0015808E5E|nr:hypothetical protein [Mesobacillus harenae]
MKSYFDFSSRTEATQRARRSSWMTQKRNRLETSKLVSAEHILLAVSLSVAETSKLGSITEFCRVLGVFSP